MSAFPGVQALRAQKGALLSPPRLLAPGDPRAELVLHAGFRVEGTINRPTADWITGTITPRITFSVRQGTLWRELGTVAVQGDAESFGPLDLPLLKGDEYRAQVHGVTLIPTDTRFDPPSPGETLRLALKAEIGLLHWYLVSDTSGVTLPHAEVEVSWAGDGRELAVRGYARADGFVPVFGIRPGTVISTASCPGYASERLVPMELPLAEPGYTGIELHPGGILRGRATRNGAPVRDFRVSVWPGTSTQKRVSQAFQHREDGAFELVGVPRGSLGIAATSPESPGSEAVQVDVGEEPVWVDLALLDTIPGRGTVVDKATGATVPAATVQALMTTGRGPGDPWGLAEPVKSDGSFLLKAFIDGEGFLRVDAPGYGTRIVSTMAAAGALDFGVLELLPRVALDIVVLGLDPSTTHMLLSGTGPEEVSLSGFEVRPDGARAARLESLSQGLYRFVLALPDDSEIWTYFEVGKRASELRFTAAGRGRILVHMDPKRERRGEAVLFDYRSDDGLELQRLKYVRGSDELAVEGIPEGPVGLRLLDRGETLAVASVQAVEGATASVALLEGTAALNLRVHDGDEKPLSNVFVRLWPADPTSTQVSSGATDAEGNLRLQSLLPGAYVLDLVHASAGTSADREIAVRAGEDTEVAVELSAQAQLYLELYEEEGPLAGVGCAVLNRLGQHVLEPVFSNSEGHATIGGFLTAPIRSPFKGPTCGPSSASSRHPPAPSRNAFSFGALGA
jgi:hypothetical protein